MPTDTFEFSHIVLAIVFGLLAGGIYMVVGTWTQRRRARAEPTGPAIDHGAPISMQRTAANDEAVARFLEELKRPDQKPPVG